MEQMFVRRPNRARVTFLKLLRSDPEGRPAIDAEYLRTAHDDVFGEVENDDAAEIIRRYLEIVGEKRIDPDSTFCELAYLAHNPDVLDEIEGGRFYCGYHHWLEVGRFETRFGWKKRASRADDAPRGPAAGDWTPFFVTLERFGVGDPALLSIDQAADVLRHCGLVDSDRYASLYPDLIEHRVDPIRHYVRLGYRERRSIHPFFDDAYYLEHCLEARQSDSVPLLHYLFVGARHGKKPHPLIDTEAYAAKFKLDLSSTNPLIHYNMSPDRDDMVTSPHFDHEFYVRHHPECQEFPGGAFQHFINYGVYSGYKPSAQFNTRYYYATHLQGDYSKNAYFHYLDYGHAQGLATDIPTGVSTMARDIRFFANPGPMFEELDPGIARGKARRGKVISFYLPQFHAFPENEEWWGKGFSEWRNLPRAAPRFAGHYQPRIPRDLSFYDLTHTDVIRRQIAMATSMGVWGFAFYFYWFNRHRLMESPLDAFVADKSLAMPFMLVWANENWTRRWDGADSEILIQQDHFPGDDEALVDCFQSYFSDTRYIRLNGRPLLVIYRADIIPEAKQTIATWKRLFRERHGEEPIIFMAQTFGAENPDLYGFDGAIEFPPHKIGSTLPEINRELQFHDWDFEGSVRKYSDAVKTSLSEPSPNFPLVKTVFPSWDNNARRQTGGMVFHGATPQRFATWLDGALDFAQAHPVEGENLIFVNAWNEWCEGAYLEPDVHLGGAMLNSLATAVTANRLLPRDKTKLLLIGHDAFPAGAQRNLLSIAKLLQNRFGVDIHVILLEGGKLLEQYQAAVPTTLCNWNDVVDVLKALSARGFRNALLNTVVTGITSGPLKELGFRVTCLVHELPQIIEEYALQPHADGLRRNADAVVFPTDFVKQAFERAVGPVEHETVLLAQGIYQRFERDERAGRRLRERLGIPAGHAVAINAGHADLRKGVDIFCQTAHLCHQRNIPMHFVWAGDVHPALKSWLIDDLMRKGIENLHFVGELDGLADLMSAADVFFLTSREDPFPSVVLEAMQAGVPVVAFAGNGGFTDLLASDRRLGTLVPQADIDLAIEELTRLAGKAGKRKADREYRVSRAADQFSFENYVFQLLGLFDPGLKKVSVVVPNYNYSKYLSARLQSIFQQSYPIFEILVLDDASSDDSLAEIARVAQTFGREVTVIPSDTNSGSAFRQWQKGAARARGELVWIAEADDLSSSAFVETLVDQFSRQQDVSLTFTDSRSVDAEGYKVYESYIPYAESIAPDVLKSDRLFNSRDFAREALSTANLILNVSSVLWRKEVLLSAFEAGGDAFDLKVAGDWRLYLAACMAEGSVAYVASPLNIHRRHATSITNELSIEAHIREIEFIHALVKKSMRPGRGAAERQRLYRQQVEQWLRNSVPAAE